jgi:apolipoprotein N-acyltransferase
MCRILGGVAALAMVVAAASGQVPPASEKKVTTAKHSAVAAKKPMTALQKSVAKKRALTSASTRNTSSRNTTTRKQTSTKPAVTWRNRQLQPTQDRYKDIQTALASKGYLQPEQATGAWDQNSTDALKQFQAAQNLDTSGKINSLSLIALGLGPKHETAPAIQAVQPAEQNR